jgi:hypothetical protein
MKSTLLTHENNCYSVHLDWWQMVVLLTFRIVGEENSQGACSINQLRKWTKTTG